MTISIEAPEHPTQQAEADLLGQVAQGWTRSKELQNTEHAGHTLGRLTAGASSGTATYL